MFVEILIYTQPADFYCHLSAINVSNDRLFAIYSRFHPLSHIQFQVRRTDLTIISDRHVKKTWLRSPTGAFQWVQFCFLVAWIILRDSGEIAVVRWCCSAPGDARRQSNFLHVTCMSGETPSRDTFFSPLSWFPSTAVVENKLSDRCVRDGVILEHPTLVLLDSTSNFGRKPGVKFQQVVVSKMRATFIDWSDLFRRWWARWLLL